MYQPRSEVNGVALAELFGKMIQSNPSIDIDNDLTLHVLTYPEVTALKENKRLTWASTFSLKDVFLQPLDNMMIFPVLVTPWP